MIQTSAEMSLDPKSFRLSERAVAHLLLTAICVSQFAWFGLLGFAAWRLIF